MSYYPTDAHPNLPRAGERILVIRIRDGVVERDAASPVGKREGVALTSTEFFHRGCRVNVTELYPTNRVVAEPSALFPSGLQYVYVREQDADMAEAQLRASYVQNAQFAADQLRRHADDLIAYANAVKL